MLRKLSRLAAGLFCVVAFLFLGACDTATNSNNTKTIYRAGAGFTENGSCPVNPASGYEGTEISVTVSPEAGYRLKSGTLKYSGAGGDTPIDETTLKFSLPAAHVTVTAEFEPLQGYRVNIGELLSGDIVAEPPGGPEGTEIVLSINPYPGYRLKSGSLKYSGNAGDTAIDETACKFFLPAGNVTITAKFERAAYTVNISSLANGSIIPSPASGSAGTEIALTVTANTGYRLKGGSLKYTGPAGDTTIDETTLKFFLPSSTLCRLKLHNYWIEAF
jgi:hypothetical protein